MYGQVKVSVTAKLHLMFTCTEDILVCVQLEILYTSVKNLVVKTV